jgi:hypothetical protein
MTWSTLITSRRAVRASIIGLLLSVSLGVPAAQAQQLSVEVSIAEVTFEEGLVMVTGTVTCSEPTNFTDVSVEVRQPVGRFKSVVGGVGESLGPCTGELPFDLSIAPFSGSFKQGAAFVFANASGCTEFACDGDSATETVNLKK